MVTIAASAAPSHDAVAVRLPAGLDEALTLRAVSADLVWSKAGSQVPLGLDCIAIVGAHNGPPGQACAEPGRLPYHSVAEAWWAG